jgi:hypothetical protein
MAKVTYDKEITALLVSDPYNDFISEGGKVWDRLKGVAEANQCVPHMLQVLNAARKAKIRVFYALHHRYRPGDYETWKYIALTQKAAWVHKTFENGTVPKRRRWFKCNLASAKRRGRVRKGPASFVSYRTFLPVILNPQKLLELNR